VAFSTNKTDRHVITKIFLKVALSTINPNPDASHLPLIILLGELGMQTSLHMPLNSTNVHERFFILIMHGIFAARH
jgi:hypothetical protein